MPQSQADESHLSNLCGVKKELEFSVSHDIKGYLRRQERF